METLEQTIMQVERFIRKVAQKFPAPESDDETSQMTDKYSTFEIRDSYDISY